MIYILFIIWTFNYKRKRGRPKKNFMENARKKTKLNDEIEFDLDKNMKYIFSDIYSL